MVTRWSVSEVVYCHQCCNEWFEDDWGLTCPHCECEATEIVLLDDNSGSTGETSDGPETIHQLENDERSGSTSRQNGTYVNKGKRPLREAEASTAMGWKTETATEKSPNVEVVVAVMGVTGSGKSTFIRSMTENQGVHVGHGLESDTSEVGSFKFTHGNIDFVLVDTPGFNDTSCSDEDVLTRVLEWLESSYRSGMRLNGLIYLHRIIDPKIQGSSLSSLRMFRKLCGPKCFQNIVLATTFWDEVSPAVGAQREQQLMESSEFWDTMVKKGSQVVRLGRSRNSGLKVLMEIAKKNKITLLSQHEMVEENRSAQDTAAAQSINEELLRQKREFEQKLEAQKVQHAMELERRRTEKQRKLEKERIAAEKKQRKMAALEAARKQREEEEWRATYERNQRELRERQLQAEREKREMEAREKRIREDLEKQRREEEELKAERKRYYNNYTCQRTNESEGIYCNKCWKDIKDAAYWHCCHCRSDNYDLCESCASGLFTSCGVDEHPWMKRGWKSAPADDSCTVM